MQRLELLIKQARSESQNKAFSLKAGIPQQDFVFWVNEAQERLYSEAIKQHPVYFTGEVILDSMSGQEAYDLPGDIFLSHIEMIEYSVSGQTKDYYRLEQARLPERISYPTGNPGYYIRRGKQILMVPAPATGGPAKIRISYVKKLPRIDVRRGYVAAATIVGENLTALTLNAGSLLSVDPDAFADYNFLTVVDRNGAVKAARIEYDTVNVGTGFVTLTGGSHALGGATIAVGDYVTLGPMSANLPDLPDTAERFLIEWLTYRATFRDGSTRSAQQKALCDEILADTMQAFADIEHDTVGVTILNTDYLDAQRIDIL